MASTTDYAAAMARLDAWVAESGDRLATLYCYDGVCGCCVEVDGEKWRASGATFTEAITLALDAMAREEAITRALDAMAQEEATDV